MDLEQQRLLKLKEDRRKEEKEFEDAYDNFKEEYGEEDAIDENDFREIIINKPEEPSFPYFIFGLAILKDGLDIIIAIISVFTAGIALTILIWIIWISSLIVGVIIWIWIFSKSTLIRKMIIKILLTPLVLLILEMIPGLNALPMSSITVFFIYRSEKGIVKKIIDSLEKVENEIGKLGFKK